MKQKRVYSIEGSAVIETGDEIGSAYIPDFTVIPSLLENYRPGTDDDHWDVITSEDHTDGVHNSYLVGIYTTIENHTILESQDHITRINGNQKFSNELKKASPNLFARGRLVEHKNKLEIKRA